MPEVSRADNAGNKVLPNMRGATCDESVRNRDVVSSVPERI